MLFLGPALERLWGCLLFPCPSASLGRVPPGGIHWFLGYVQGIVGASQNSLLGVLSWHRGYQALAYNSSSCLLMTFPTDKLRRHEEAIEGGLQFLVCLGSLYLYNKYRSCLMHKQHTFGSSHPQTWSRIKIQTVAHRCCCWSNAELFSSYPHSECCPRLGRMYLWGLALPLSIFYYNKLLYAIPQGLLFGGRRGLAL